MRINKQYIPIEPTDRQMLFLMLNCRDAFYGGAAGGGKILSNEGVILTPFGFKKGIELKVGDLVNNPDGSIQRIIQIKPEIELPLWRVYFSDNTFTDVAKDHLWLAWKTRKSRKIKNKRSFGEKSAEVVETREILEWLDQGYNPQIPICEEQHFNLVTKEKDRIDPYLLGVILGDGCTTQTNITITCNKKDSIHYLNLFKTKDLNFSNKTIRFIGDFNKYLKNKLNLYKLLGKKSNEKFIPYQYKFGSIKNRYKLIQGLLDTDGFNDKKDNGCYYYTVSKQLSEDVAFVLRSLGAMVTITSKIGSYKDTEGLKHNCQRVYNLYIKHRKEKLFSLERKKSKKQTIEISKRIIKIEVDGTIKGRCITVSNPNGLYITNDFIVTHNSVALFVAGLLYVHVPGYNAILIRDTMANLQMPHSIMDLSFQWLLNTDAHWNGEKKRWTFPSGATLSFGYLEDPKAHFNYQSAEFQYVALDEAVAIRENQGIYMFSRLRKLKGVEIPTRFRAASNPPADEQISRGQWIKIRYVDDITRKKGVIFVPAKMDDNPHLDREDYRESLSQLDPITRKQLEEGDWEIKKKGKTFNRGWYEIVDQSPIDCKKVRYWDMAATEPSKMNKEPCYTAGVKMSMDKNKIIYIESIIRTRKEPGYVEKVIRQTADMDSKKVIIWQEQEPGSSGKITFDHYRRNVLPEFAFYPDKVSGNKLDRARPFSSYSEAGNVKVVKGAWNEEFFNEIELFPDGPFKDQVDACSGAFNKLFIPNGPRIRIIGEDNNDYE